MLRNIKLSKNIYTNIRCFYLSKMNFSSYSTDLFDQIYQPKNPHNNMSETLAIKASQDVKLHVQPNHPLEIIKNKIYKCLNGIPYEISKNNEFKKQNENSNDFRCFDNISPISNIYDNFDKLLIPEDHVSRKPSDTYYISNTEVLRTHTSAHQSMLLKEGHSRFLVTGDVYRRDEIDSSHYPVFHQMEGVRVFDCNEFNINEIGYDNALKYVENDLKKTLEYMVEEIFGKVEMRWVDAYFPFTEPSFELEIYFNDDWLEVLGCGVIQQQIINDANRDNNIPGWAFGLGLERLAMVLFSIPDIRLFWSKDRRFLDQFKDGEIITFKPFSKYPPCYKDLSFWLNDIEYQFEENDLYEIIRDIGKDLIEEVKLIDDFIHPKTNKKSLCYRIIYRSMERSLTDNEINLLQDQVRLKVEEKLDITLR